MYLYLNKYISSAVEQFKTSTGKRPCWIINKHNITLLCMNCKSSLYSMLEELLAYYIQWMQRQSEEESWGSELLKTSIQFIGYSIICSSYTVDNQDARSFRNVYPHTHEPHSEWQMEKVLSLKTSRNVCA